MSSKHPKVSIIIPTYNRARYITKALDSILAQTFPDYEIIIVDDGSKDNSQAVLKPYIHKIKYIYQDHQGANIARNRGLHESKAELIAFLDSDDEWCPNNLSFQIEKFTKNKGLCLHTTNAKKVLSNGETVNHFQSIGFRKSLKGKTFIERPLEYQIRYGFARLPSTIIRRETLFKAGLFDPNMQIYQDLDLMCRLALQGGWGVSDYELVYFYRRREDIEHVFNFHSANPVKAASNLVYLYEKLYHNHNLTLQEKRFVKKVLSSSMSNLGIELVKEKQTLKAIPVLRQAMIKDPSLKSVLRCLLTFLPTNCASRCVSIWHRFRWHVKL